MDVKSNIIKKLLSALRGYPLSGFIIFAILGVVIFWLSDNVAWIGDSLSYQYSTVTGEKIKSIPEIFAAQYAYYFYSNGRFIAHVISRYFLAIVGQTGFSVCNALVYIVFVNVVMIHSGLSLRNWRQILLATLLVLFYCDTDYGPNFQVGYVWMFLLTLVYVLLFFSSYVSTKRPLSLVALFVFSLLTGNGHEVLNIGIGGAVLIYVLYNIRQTTLAQWIMLSGFAVGGAILCLSPAAWDRASMSESVPYVYSILQVVLGFRAFYILVILIVGGLVCRKLSLVDWYKSNKFYINAMFVLFAFDCLIGVTTRRQLLGVELLSTILILRTLRDVRVNTYILAAASLCIVWIYATKIIEISKAQKAYRQLVTAVRNCTGDVIFIDFPAFSSFVAPTGTLRHGSYFDYVLWCALTEIRGDIKHEPTKIRLYPTAMRGVLESDQPRDTVIEYLPGEFVVARMVDSNSRAILHRSVDIFGLKKSLPDTEFDINDGNSKTEGVYRVLFLPNILPVITNDSVNVMISRAERR